MNDTIKTALIAGSATIIAALVAVVWPKRESSNPSITASSGSTVVQQARDIVINSNGSISSSSCSLNYLKLTLEDHIGAMNNPTRDWNAGYFRRFRFSISNPTNYCTALVVGLFVELLDFSSNPEGPPEGLSIPFKYKVAVAPSDKGKLLRITDDRFKLLPNDLDDFVVDLEPTKWGYNYLIRFVAAWRDAKSEEERRSLSWTAMAPFPGNHDPGAPPKDPDNSEKWMFGSASEAYFANQKELLAAARKRFDDSDDAVMDAKKDDPPIILR
jgi:hypothetical protein